MRGSKPEVQLNPTPSQSCTEVTDEITVAIAGAQHNNFECAACSASSGDLRWAAGRMACLATDPSPAPRSTLLECITSYSSSKTLRERLSRQFFLDLCLIIMRHLKFKYLNWFTEDIAHAAKYSVTQKYVSVCSSYSLCSQLPAMHRQGQIRRDPIKLDSLG